MTKYERVMSVIAGEAPDYTPTGFWIHFPGECAHGAPAVQAHLDFFEQTGSDICKVMNENLQPCIHPVQSAADLRHLRPQTPSSPEMRDQLEVIRRISDKVRGEAVVLATVHGLLVSTHHGSGKVGDFVANRHCFRDYLQNDPKALKDAFDAVSEGLAALSQAFLEAGADGIYYAALGAEKDVFTAEEYEAYVRPYELKIFGAAAHRRAFNVLHACKTGLDLSKYHDYPAEVVNWAVHKNNPTLKEGRELFPDKVLLGGLDDRAGVLVDGTEQEIERAVFDLVGDMGSESFILGTDCTLPTAIDYSRIAAAVQACKRYPNEA